MANNLDLKIRISGEDNTGQAFGKTRAGIQSISQQLTVMQTRFQQFLALKIGEIIGNQVGKVIQTADGFKTLQARLKLVSDTTAEYNIAQKEVFNIAQRTLSDLESVAGVYGKVETAVKQLGGTQQDALGVTETINQAIALTSQGTAQNAAAILQFSQALGSGVLRGDEFNSVMENSPGLAKALADGLQVPITALRGMAEAGQLTADKLINALGKAAPEVAKQFAQLPVTVGQAFTQLNNEFTRYIGEADAAGGATAKLAASIQFAAENFKPLAETALTLAGVYGVTLLQGLVKSGAAMVDSVLASRAKLAAERELLAGEIQLAQYQAQLAASALNAAKANMEMAIAQKKAATGFFETAIAANNAKAAIQGYYTASTAAAEKQAALAALTTKTAAAMTLAQKAAAGLNAALNLMIAYEIGKTIGEWIDQTKIGSIVFNRLAEAVEIAATGMRGMASGISFSDRLDEIKEIHARYNLVAKAVDETAVAEKSRSEIAKAGAELAVKNLKAEVDAYKDLEKAAKDAATQQLSKVDDKTTQRVRTIETTVTDTGGVDRSREQERQITQVLIDANKERERINKATADARLKLIDEAHAKEVEAAKKANQSTKDIDKSWLDSKYKVLQEWQSSSRKTIDELIALEKKHRDAAIQADTDIANHKQSTAALIKQLSGKDEVNNKQDLSRLQGDAVLQKRGINDALNAGDTDKALKQAKQVEAAYIDVAQKAKGLFDQGLIDQSAVDITLYDLQQAANQVDSITAKQGEEQKLAAEQVAGEIAKQQASLADVNNQLDAVIEKAKQVLIINVDKTAIDAAKAAIDAIPSEKTVTIKTVNEGGAPVTPADQAVPGYADGTRLTGFGGGDKHPALLEGGEGVINKFGMRALDKSFGPGFFDGINAGANPIELLRRNMQTLKLSDGGRINVSLPSVDFSNAGSQSGGTPVNIHLPDGQQFGPFNGSGDSASALAAALQIEVIKRGRRTV
ncbi:MAG: tape measure protein [Thiomicrospira sp.]